MEAQCRNDQSVKEHPSPYRYPQHPRTPPNSFAWSLSREGPHYNCFGAAYNTYLKFNELNNIL